MIRRLITDADVLAGRVTSPIVLDEGTLLTPAARDRATVRGLVIVERDATGAAGSAPAARTPSPAGTTCTGGCAECGQGGCGGCGVLGDARVSDGLYLVRIEGGRAVSMLPAAGPGQMTPARRGSSP